MKIFEIEKDCKENIYSALSPEIAAAGDKIRDTVAEIISDVRTRGDAAVLEMGKKFDSPELESLKVSQNEIESAYELVPKSLIKSIKTAKANIEKFHRKQLQNSWIETNQDFVYGQLVTPISKVGLYAPAGLAPLFSTIIMTAVPAKLAGVDEMVLCAAPQKDGHIFPAMLVAANECGVDRIYKASGAQAIAAMAFGTESLPKVDKIFGPGNAFVAEAKRQVFGYVGIDQIAGPSEVLIIADESANPAFVAADLLAQAEHAEDSRCVLATTSREIADAVLKELREQTEASERKELINASLNRYGSIIICRNIEECAKISNYFAPEHLELAVKEPWETLKLIKNAGTIMLGSYTPVPLCDYAAGPNHTLPTAGTARFSSALSVDDFIKKSGLLSYTKEALNKLAPTVIEMAEAEGLTAHANTVKLRKS